MEYSDLPQLIKFLNSRAIYLIITFLRVQYDSSWSDLTLPILNYIYIFFWEREDNLRTYDFDATLIEFGSKNNNHYSWNRRRFDVLYRESAILLKSRKNTAGPRIRLLLSSFVHSIRKLW